MVADDRHRQSVPVGWDLPPDGEATIETLGFLDEFQDLGRRGLIGATSDTASGSPEGRIAPVDSFGSAHRVQPSELRTAGLGSLLVEAAHLERIPLLDRTLRTWDEPPKEDDEGGRA
jgi:hypothetical protein